MDFIRQRASHLWTAFHKSVYSVWFYIGVYAVSLWIIWQGLQQANSISICMSALWIIYFSWILSGDCVNYNEINIKGFSISVTFFIGLVVLVGHIRILIFPIALSIPLSKIILEEFDLDWYDDWYYETYLGSRRRESNLIERVWISKKEEQYYKRNDFIDCLVLFMGGYFFFFLLACFATSDEGFKKIVVLNASIIAALSMFLLFLMYKNEKEIRPIRKAMGGYISHDAINELELIFRARLDTDRIQFLLHDTLKERLGNNVNNTMYDSPQPAWYENEFVHTNKIKTLFRVFPSIASTMYTADDEGDIPFRLACQYSSVEVVKYMIELDNDLLNIRDSKGNTVMHYACRGNNYKVINYLLNRHMILAVTRNFDGNLPVYILCSSERVHKWGIRGDPHRLFVEEAPRPQHLETVMKLLLAYPEDMQEKLQAASPSKEKEPAPFPTLTEQAVDSEGGDALSAPSSKPQKHLKLLAYILVVVNIAAAIYIGTLQSLSNTNQMKHHSEVKQLVDKLVASQNEMNLLRSRMETLKYLHGQGNISDSQYNPIYK